MKKSLISLGIAAMSALSSIPASAEDLIYVPVDPCRLVDTRNAGGAIAADTPRKFDVSGTDMSDQGGTASGCADPKGGAVKPLAISAYVLVAQGTGAGTGPGVLTAYASNQLPPAVGQGSTVNYAPVQIIGNTTNIPLCDNDCTDGEFAILARTTSQNVVVDVQGYYYPASSTSCPSDMVAVGSLCVDTYEASLWDAATGGSGIPASTCDAGGTDCATGAANPIYARSQAGVLPITNATWYQAAIACANVGKRLPSVAEWQMAAAGTPNNGTDCNSPTGGGSLAMTGAFAACVSTAGAFDMVGNLWEWTADITATAAIGSGTDSLDDADVIVLGESFTNSVDTTPGTDSAFVPGSGPAGVNPVIGFRCVK